MVSTHPFLSQKLFPALFLPGLERAITSTSSRHPADMVACQHMGKHRAKAKGRKGEMIRAPAVNHRSLFSESREDQSLKDPFVVPREGGGRGREGENPEHK